jgi:replicative DNA helicase
LDERNGTSTTAPRRDRKRFQAEERNLQKLFDRLPPHSLEAEMSLLGSMILDHSVIGDVIEIVPLADAFYSEAHAAIFDALVRLYDRKQSGDLVQLSEALKDRDVFEDVGGTDYLLNLAQSVPSAASAPYYAEIVREKWQLRRLIDASGEIVYSAYHAGEFGDDGARTVLDKAEQSIFEIAEQAESGGQLSMKNLLVEVMESLDRQDGRSVTGVASGFYELDEMTSGLQPGEMIIVAARPSMGKTAFALNLTEQIAFGGGRYEGKGDGTTPVGFFSLEMSQASVVQRLLSAHSGVDSHRMRTNRLSKDDFADLMHSCGLLEKAPIYIDDTPGLTVMNLRAKARRMVKQYGVKCLVIDYLQLMSAPSAAREGRQQEVSTISRQIKALARELKLPIICLAQLNRGAEQREGHRPRMADLRESGSIEQDADVIALLHREEYYHLQDPSWAEENPDKIGLAELIIAKQRNGPTGTVKMSWDARVTRFRNYASPGSGGGYMPAPRQEEPGAGAYVEPRPGGFAPGSRTGPVEDHRDGGGNEPDWDDANDDGLPM